MGLSQGNGSLLVKRLRNKMLDTATIKLIEEKIKLVEAQGFGEVIIKVKNGAVYRIIPSFDILIEKADNSKTLDKS